MDRQGNLYTFIYASVLVVVVAALLAFVSQSLKPIQDKNIEVAKMIDILKSVKIVSTSKDAVEKYDEYVGDNAVRVHHRPDGDRARGGRPGSRQSGLGSDQSVQGTLGGDRARRFDRENRGKTSGVSVDSYQ